MSDAEKPMALDLASTAELREQLFAANARLAKVVALNEKWQGSDQTRRMPAGLLIDALRDALK